MLKSLKHFFIALSLLFFIPYSSSSAEGVNQNATKERRADLQRQLGNLEVQISGYRQVIEQKQTESSSLKRDIAILDAKIQRAKLEIKKIDVEIEKAKIGIKQKTGQITFLTIKGEKQKDSLAELIRENNEVDSVNLMEIILGYEKISDFFVSGESLDPVRLLVQNTINDINEDKDRLEREKGYLDIRKEEQARLKTAQEAERKKLASNEEEKKKILKTTNGLEKEYQSMLLTRQKDAANIRSQLFLLSGSPSISFEKAVEYADLVWKMLKIRPAFLLGVIREESNLGANVGKGNWKEDLAHAKCAKQRESFVQITSELGLDPDLLPVSKKQWYGNCGGAMGPAQFMPTTWQMYKKNISKITGNNPPNPWEPKDAFVAAGLLLKDNGAATGGSAAERKAALKYLAGSNWNNPSYRFYGNDVMDFAVEYQEQIDIINKLASR